MTPNQELIWLIDQLRENILEDQKALIETNKQIIKRVNFKLATLEKLESLITPETDTAE